MDWKALLTALILAGCIPTAHGQQTVADLRAQIEQLQVTLEAMNQRLAVLEQQPPEQTVSRPSELTTAQPPGNGSNSAAVAVMPARESVANPSAAASRHDNALSPTEPEVQGFIPIPGTQTLFRLGGYAKLDAIADAHSAGDENQFVTAAIPVGRPGHGNGNFNLHARQTRFSFEARRPTSHGSLRFYLENDFFGNADGYQFRLRHAYGQLGNTYAGYGYSSFMDADALPDTLDFEGPGGAAYLLVAGVHHSFSLGKGNSLTVAAEDPESEVALDQDVARVSNRYPDLSLALRMERSWGHLQLAGVGRSLGYRQDGRGEHVMGGGLSFSGSLTMHEQDLLLFALLVGRGISRYVADISGSGLDAFIDAGMRLQPLRVQGGYLAYTHYWSPRWRSNLVHGALRLQRDAGLAGEVFRHSQYSAMNLIWSPSASWTMGMELLYGRLQLQDGQRADALRLQGSLQYNFIK